MSVAASNPPPSPSVHLLVISLPRYAGSARSSLGWHQDTQSAVTVLLMLSDPRGYSGGRLQHQRRATGDVDEGDEDDEDEEEDEERDEEGAAGAPQEVFPVETAALGLGDAAVYRSHHLHQVSPLPPAAMLYVATRHAATPQGAQRCPTVYRRCGAPLPPTCQRRRLLAICFVLG